MPALDVSTAIANLNVLRHRNYHRKRLVFDLVDDGHWREAIEELRGLAALDEQVDDLVRSLNVRFPAPPMDDVVREALEDEPPEPEAEGPKHFVRLHNAH